MHYSKGWVISVEAATMVLHVPYASMSTIYFPFNPYSLVIQDNTYKSNEKLIKLHANQIQTMFGVLNHRNSFLYQDTKHATDMCHVKTLQGR